jgi:hypothetical protein
VAGDHRPDVAGQATGAALRAAGQIVFALGYGGAIFLLFRQAARGYVTVGGPHPRDHTRVQVSTQIAGALQPLALLRTAGKTIDPLVQTSEPATRRSALYKSARQLMRLPVIPAPG